MPMFEKEKLSSRSKMTPIEVSDAIEDIKFSSAGSEHSKKILEEGYLPFIRKRDDFNGDLYYYIKPTEEVKKHMKKIGYGEVAGVNYLETAQTISFHSRWDSASISMTTTPQIAGVIEREKLDNKLKEIKYEGNCQVDKAYSKIYACEPNYALKYINITGKKLEQMKSLSRNMWLAAGFMLNDNDITSKAKNGDYDLSFNDPKKMEFLKENFEFEKTFYIPPNRENKASSVKKRKLN